MDTTLRRPGVFILLLAALATLLLLLASCGDDDDDTGDDGGDEAVATTPADGGDDGDNGDDDSGDDDEGDDGDDTGDDDDSGDDDGGDDDGGADGSLADLADFAEDYENFEGFVKYNSANFTGTESGSMTLYQKPGKSRIDFSSSDGDVIIIDTTEASYVCSAEQCIQYPAGDDTASGAAGIFASLISPEVIQEAFGNIPDGVEVETSNEEIAGLDATCIDYSGDVDEETPGDESGQICYSEGGLLLRIVFDQGGDTGTLEATEAGTDVSDSDFEPPFEVIDLSSIGQ